MRSEVIFDVAKKKEAIEKITGDLSREEVWSSPKSQKNSSRKRPVSKARWRLSRRSKTGWPMSKSR